MSNRLKTLSCLMPASICLFLIINSVESSEKEVAKHVTVNCQSCHSNLADLVPENHVPIARGKEVAACLACHPADQTGASPADWFAHLKHYALSDFSGDCHSCHESFNGIASETDPERMGRYYGSWADSKYLDHKHALRKVTCANCHGKAFPDRRPSMDQCINCHGNYDEIAELTKDLNPNPHMSHFPDLRCTLCHKGHLPSELYCNQCHQFELNMSLRAD
jgi:hypothetical protein